MQLSIEPNEQVLVQLHPTCSLHLPVSSPTPDALLKACHSVAWGSPMDMTTHIQSSTLHLEMGAGQGPGVKLIV